MRIGNPATPRLPEAKKPSSDIEAQIELLEKQKAAALKQNPMKVPQQIDAQIEALRASKVAEQKTEALRETEKTEETRERDTFQAAQEEKGAGVYALVTDEEGEKRIDYRSPREKTDKAGEEKEDLWLDSAKGTEDAEKPEKTEEEKKPEEEEPGEGDSPEKEKKPRKSGATTTMDASAPLAEIKKLKEKQAALQAELARAGDDENERKRIEAQLAQVDASLAIKDNPEYIKRNAKVTTVEEATPPTA